MMNKKDKIQYNGSDPVLQKQYEILNEIKKIINERNSIIYRGKNKNISEGN